MKSRHIVKDIRFNSDEMIMTVDGKQMKFCLEKISSVLKNASGKDRDNFVISPSGYGIHWPTLDEDLSIDGLLGITHESRFKKHAA